MFIFTFASLLNQNILTKTVLVAPKYFNNNRLFYVNLKMYLKIYFKTIFEVLLTALTSFQYYKTLKYDSRGVMTANF